MSTPSPSAATTLGFTTYVVPTCREVCSVTLPARVGQIWELLGVGYAAVVVQRSHAPGPGPRRGASMLLELLDLPGVLFAATLTSGFGRGRLGRAITFDPERRLRAGMAGRAVIRWLNLTPLLVPSGAVVMGDPPVVRVETSEGIVQRQVQLGRAHGTQVQVLRGLSRGERVLVPDGLAR